MKNLFLLNKRTENNENLNPGVVDNYNEIAMLVKEARIQKNLSIKKLERCLVLRKHTLVKLAFKEKDSYEIKKRDFLVSKFDLINNWVGSLLYFLILVLTIFILKRYFILNVNVIEIQNIENKISDQ